MSMYDRAARTLAEPVGSTPKTVGPGSYSYNGTTTSKRKVDSFAPFASMTTRHSVLDVDEAVIAAPGPGQYEVVRGNTDKVKGGTTLMDKTKRFDSTSTLTPGPGAYNVMVFDKSAQKSRKSTEFKPRVQYLRRPDAPSIPVPNKAYGFEESTEGYLIPQKPPSRDITIGPAYYKVAEHPHISGGSKYKGVNFARQSSKRLEFNSQPGPAPGDYNVGAGHKADGRYIQGVSGNHVFESHTSRYLDMLQKQEERKGIPGPGSYDIKGSIAVKSNAPLIDEDGNAIEVVPFGCQAKRFIEPKYLTPAPGNYDESRTAFQSTRKITNLKAPPFGQSTARFHNDRHKKLMPGPGTYNYSGLSDNSMRKTQLQSSRKGPFGSTSIRTVPLADGARKEIPGPGYYRTIDEKSIGGTRYTKPTAQFMSNSDRMAALDAKATELPGPGSYDLSKSYDRSQGNVLSVPANAIVKTKSIPFLSSTDRIDNEITREKKGQWPSPAEYESNSVSRPAGKKGIFEFTGERFRDTFNTFPGPGAYNLSVQQDNTVLKGTFNVKLGRVVSPPASMRRTKRPIILKH